MTGKITSIAVSLYFHIPFCKKKCPYCHFFVLPDKEALKDQFLRSLKLEWESQLPKLIGTEITSIYFGGGTPTRLPPTAFANILGWIRQGPAFIAHDCEITLEANPEDISTEQIKEFSDLGINRISLGVQSLDDSSLQTLDRRHTAKRSIEAIHTSSDGGIDNISIDLMYELPEQTLQSWQHTLQMAESLPITHLSLYNLTFEPHTVFFKKKKELLPRVPAAETSLAMLQEAVAVLEHIGLKRYEISAFAKAGFASRHNSGYWTARPFLGFGPSAFSYWDKKRYSNVSNLNQYSAALKKGLTAVDFEELLPCPDSQKELLAIELRLLRGVDLKNFQARHGNLPNEVLLNLELLQSKGWIERDGTRIKLSPEGLLFYDSIGEILI